jgi:hypothetical protein
MSVINFPGGPEPHIDRELVERAVALKQRLIAFATSGPLAERYRELFEEQGVDGSDFGEFVDFTDWFIFEWEGEDGARVIDEFAESESELEPDDLRILEAWGAPVSDLFTVVAVRPEGILLADEEGARYFAVPTSLGADQMGLEPGLTLGTRLVPVGEVYLLSGTQEVYSDEAGPDERIVDQWLYDAFVEHFGADEIVVEAEDVGDRLEAYAHFVIDVFKPAGAGGKTMRELFELAGEGDVDLDVFGDLSLPGAAGTVGLLADPDEGPALVPFYDALRGYLERGEGDAEMVRELLVDLIDDPQIPPFVIRRLAAAGPGRFSRLMAEALDEPEFDVERDLDDLLEDFKGDVDLDDLDEEEDDLVFADDLVDVRDLAPDERPAGSIAAAAYDFLAETAESFKPTTLEAHALGVNMLYHYAVESGYVAASQLDEGFLVDFLAVWYPRFWGRRSISGAKRLLTTVGKFTSWLDATTKSTIGQRFKGEVLPALKEDLPRVVRAAEAIDGELLPLDLEALDATLRNARDPESLVEAIGAAIEPSFDPNALAGGWTILEVAKDVARAARRDDESDERVFAIELSEEAAEALAPGDVVVGILVPAGERWRVTGLLAVHPPIAGR